MFLFWLLNCISRATCFLMITMNLIFMPFILGGPLPNLLSNLCRTAKLSAGLPATHDHHFTQQLTKTVVTDHIFNIFNNAKWFTALSEWWFRVRDVELLKRASWISRDLKQAIFNLKLLDSSLFTPRLHSLCSSQNTTGAVCVLYLLLSVRELNQESSSSIQYYTHCCYKHFRKSCYLLKTLLRLILCHWW